MKHRLLTLLIFPALLPSAMAASFVNGSFEDPVTTAGITLFYTGQEIPGWRVEAGTIEILQDTLWHPAGDGFQSIDMVGIGVRGAMAQDVSFENAGRYHISFELSKNPLIDGNVELGIWYKPPSATDYIGLGMYGYNTDNSNADMMWIETATVSFDAEPGLTTFLFASLTGCIFGNINTWGGAAVDNVALVEGSSPLTPLLPPDYADVAPPPLFPGGTDPGDDAPLPGGGGGGEIPPVPDSFHWWYAAFIAIPFGIQAISLRRDSRLALAAVRVR